jgi:transcriptional regulator with XRE-family HTH domain
MNLFQITLMNEKRMARITSEFGTRVKAMRLKNNLTQLDLAAELGVDERQIRRIENGENPTSLPMVYLIAEALGVKVGDLFDFKI